MTQFPIPFGGPSPKEVYLPRAPLVRAVGQVNFPLILSIASQEKIAGLQDRLRKDYPHLTPEYAQRLDIMPGSAPVVRQETIWRFQDLRQQWRISLSTSFIALDTPSYTRRDDFLERFSQLFEVLEEVFSPGPIQRIGLRYMNQVKGPAFARIRELVKPEFVGAVGGDFGGHVTHLLTESSAQTDEGNLTARWGKFAANMTFDPFMLPPIDSESWLQDLDIAKDYMIEMTPADLTAHMRAFAERLYAVFRFMVTDEFLHEYGGKP